MSSIECIDDIVNDSVLVHHSGHRARLKEKFAKAPHGLLDYELLELVLFFVIPRKDVKVLAKDLLKRFGSLSGIISAAPDKFIGVPHTAAVMHVCSVLREIFSRSLRENVEKKYIISSWTELIEYLRMTMGHRNVEEFHILFLNKKNELIVDEVQNTGTIDQAAVYPREVVKRALYHDASSIIIAHNHPTGNVEPSKQDISVTEKIVDACKLVNVSVHDHVIVSKKKVFSFKTHGLIS